MTESVIADFVARFVVDDEGESELERGRVLMSQRRLVLAEGDGRTTVPLASVFDVAVGEVPDGVAEFFDDTVTIAFDRDGTRHTAVVEAGADTIDRFVNLLFRACLHDTEVLVRHPARIGGRVTDAAPRKALLRLRDRSVAFTGLDSPFTVDLSAVTHFTRVDRELDGRERPLVCVRHMPEGESITTEIALDSPRKLNLLGRYLRLEYSEVIAAVRDIEVPEDEMELLVALYSGGSEADLARMLGHDASEVTMLLESLRGKGLVVDRDDGPDLTVQGLVVVSDRIEEVNV